jgi:hypothetical protein
VRNLKTILCGLCIFAALFVVFKNINHYFFCIIVVAALIGVFIGVRSSKFSSELSTERIMLKKNFMTGNEVEFYRRIMSSVPELVVVPQVSMGAVFETSLSRDNPEYWNSRGLFDKKIIDFLICSQDMKPLCIIELDDKTHTFSKDAKRDTIGSSSGLTTIRFWSRSKPSPIEIREIIGRHARGYME